MTRNGFRFVGTVVASLLALSINGSAQRGGGPPNKRPDHTARQARPIALGVSGGNASDIANGFCCSGTLGALVTDGQKQFILSNTHVFAGDVALGGNNRIAKVGDDVDQSGLIDVGCQVHRQRHRRGRRRLGRLRKGQYRCSHRGSPRRPGSLGWFNPGDRDSRGYHACRRSSAKPSRKAVARPA